MTAIVIAFGLVMETTFVVFLGLGDEAIFSPFGNYGETFSMQ